MPSLIDSVSGRYGSENELLSGEAQFQTEAAREQPQQFKMEQQGFQQQMRAGRTAEQQAQMLNRMMMRQMDPRLWARNAAAFDPIIAATTDPGEKSILQGIKTLIANGAQPQDVAPLLSHLDTAKWAREMAQAGQYGSVAALNNAVGGMLFSGGGAVPSGGAAPTGPGTAPSVPSGGFHIGTATAPDGSRHAVLLDSSNNIVRDLGLAP